MGEFLRQIPNYRANTVETVRLAIAAREHLFSIAEEEGIDFDLERRGILHIYKTQKEIRRGKQGERDAARRWARPRPC
jgi:D-amino-acid dehydrogenase